MGNEERVNKILEMSKTMAVKDIAEALHVSASLVRYHIAGGKNGKYRKKLAKESRYPGAAEIFSFENEEAVAEHYHVSKTLAGKWWRQAVEDAKIAAREEDEELAVRKLTARECWRLMDLGDEAYDKASQVTKEQELYKQAGNAIVKNCLVGVIGQMYPGHEDGYKKTGVKEGEKA